MKVVRQVCTIIYDTWCIVYVIGMTVQAFLAKKINSDNKSLWNQSKILRICIYGRGCW